MDRIEKKDEIYFFPLRLCAFASLRLIEPGAAVIQRRFARLGRTRGLLALFNAETQRRQDTEGKKNCGSYV